MRKSADELIDSYINKIAAPSPVLGPLLAMLQDDSHRRSDLETLMRLDPCLTAKILGGARTPMYGSREISDIGSALTRLGENELSKVVIRASARCMKVSEVAGYGMHDSGLWLHGLRTAIGADLLAQHCNSVAPQVAYTAGLLLDVGKRVLGTQLEGREAEAFTTPGANFVDIERELFGYCHGEIGSRMVSRWKLPNTLREAIRWHHTPKEATEHHALVWVCHVADFLALNLGGGGSIEGLGYRFETGWKEYIDISESQILSLLPSVQSQADAIIDALPAMAA